jgi:hypothetical protein
LGLPFGAGTGLWRGFGPHGLRPAARQKGEYQERRKAEQENKREKILHGIT